MEKKAIEREEKPRLKNLTRELTTILLTCCIAALVQGWSQASIIGANLQWPYAFGLQEIEGRSDSITNYWIFGGVNAMTYFAACSIGCWLSDPLNEYFWGRRGALFIAGLFTFTASIGSAFTYSWQTLFICRLFLGIGYGAKASVVPVSIYGVSQNPRSNADLVPPSRFSSLRFAHRTPGDASLCHGRHSVSITKVDDPCSASAEQLLCAAAVGLMLGSAFNLVFHGPRTVDSIVPGMAGSSDIWRQKVAWRLQIASCAIPTIPLLCLTFLCSE